MPRPRLPLAKAKLTGADRKNPQRYRARSEPDLSGRPIGAAPAYLSPPARVAWATFADELPWLTHEDRPILEAAATVRGLITSDPAGAPVALLAQYRLMLSSLGATPVDRGRIALRDRDDGDDPFAAFGRAQ